MIKSLLLVGVFCCSALGQSEREFKLRVPNGSLESHTVLLQVEVGRIVRGAEIEIYSTSGKSLGVISPFGKHSAAAGGTYLLPIPRDSIVGRTLILRVSLRYGQEKRAPTDKEVLRLRLRSGPKS